jgi:hypothetical protein
MIGSSTGSTFEGDPIFAAVNCCKGKKPVCEEVSGSGSGPSGSGKSGSGMLPISDPCCGNELPESVYLTWSVSDPSDLCYCMNGFVILLTWYGAGWSATFTDPCSGLQIKADMYCVGISYVLDFTAATTPVVEWFEEPVSGSCSPFNWVFANSATGSQGLCYPDVFNGPLSTGTITATAP